jgi:hypothetical protein
VLASNRRSDDLVLTFDQALYRAGIGRLSRSVPAGVPYDGSVSGSLCYGARAPNPRADHARATRAKVGNAEFDARRLSRRSFVVPRAPNREFGIDSFGIESLQLEILGFGFAPASLRSAAFCRAW